MTVRVIDTFQEPHVSPVTRKNTVYEGATVEVDTVEGTHVRHYASFVGPTVAVTPEPDYRRNPIRTRQTKHAHPAPRPLTDPAP